MATYKYKALDTTGNSVKGVLDADSANQVRKILRDKGLAPLNVASISHYGNQFSNTIENLFSPPVNQKQLAIVTQQLSTMLSAGVALTQALNFVSLRSSKQVSALFLAVRSKVLEGESLSIALAEFPKVFQPMYLASIEAGERAGALDAVLAHLAHYLESRNENSRSITAALLYPAILLFASAIVVSLLMVSVMPGFIEIFEQNGQALPPLTNFVVNSFDFLQLNWPWIIVAIVSTGYSIRRVATSQRSKKKWDKVVLGLPVVGDFIRNRSAEDISRTLFILGSSGVQLVESLGIAVNIVSNSHIRGELSAARHLVAQGAGFARALEEESNMPALMIQLVETGEASGQLDQVLEKVANALHTETQSSLATLMGLFEPLILVVVSSLVFTIVIALLQPIFELNSFI